MRVPANMTRQSHPKYRWQNLAGSHVWYVIFQDPQDLSDVYIVAYSEANGQRMERPCTDPNRALHRVQMFRNLWGG